MLSKVFKACASGWLGPSCVLTGAVGIVLLPASLLQLPKVVKTFKSVEQGTLLQSGGHAGFRCLFSDTSRGRQARGTSARPIRCAAIASFTAVFCQPLEAAVASPGVVALQHSVTDRARAAGEANTVSQLVYK